MNLLGWALIVILTTRDGPELKKFNFETEAGCSDAAEKIRFVDSRSKGAGAIVAFCVFDGKKRKTGSRDTDR